MQVLDEADQLLQTDQQKALAEIYQRLPQQGVGDLRLQVTDQEVVNHELVADIDILVAVMLLLAIGALKWFALLPSFAVCCF